MSTRSIRWGNTGVATGGIEAVLRRIEPHKRCDIEPGVRAWLDALLGLLAPEEPVRSLARPWYFAFVCSTMMRLQEPWLFLSLLARAKALASLARAYLSFRLARTSRAGAETWTVPIRSIVSPTST